MRKYLCTVSDHSSVTMPVERGYVYTAADNNAQVTMERFLVFFYPVDSEEELFEVALTHGIAIKGEAQLEGLWPNLKLV